MWAPVVCLFFKEKRKRLKEMSFFLFLFLVFFPCFFFPFLLLLSFSLSLPPKKKLTRLRLPPRVHDGAPPFAHHAMVPVPRLRAYRLPDRPQHAKRRPVVRCDKVVAHGLEGADGRRSGVELRDSVLGDDLPHAAGVGEGWNAFEDDLLLFFRFWGEKS